jgi:indolepyruvate ferredoxin oxidoreductase alpha subunit
MVNPLPVKLIQDFASKVDEVIVVEELDGIIEAHCCSIGVKVKGKELFGNIDELLPNKVAEKLGVPVPQGEKLDDQIPARPPVMCAGCPHRGLYYILKKNRLTVLGDIGCYTLGATAPLKATDTTICMGASVSGLHGFNKAGAAGLAGKTVAVIGDSTFMHSGITGLVNIAYNESASTVIILDNSTTGMTGHQQNPTTGFNLKGDPCTKIDLESLCRSIGIRRVRIVDPYNLEECDRAIKEEVGCNEPSVIISRRPCALLKTVKHPGPISVNSGKCIGCKACMNIGCPAISIVSKKAVIDSTQCVGCSVCSQLCRQNAIGKEA